MVTTNLNLDPIKGTSMGLKALQSHMNESYHKSVLYWPENVQKLQIFAILAS